MGATLCSIFSDSRPQLRNRGLVRKDLFSPEDPNLDALPANSLLAWWVHTRVGTRPCGIELRKMPGRAAPRSTTQAQSFLPRGINIAWTLQRAPLALGSWQCQC